MRLPFRRAAAAAAIAAVVVLPIALQAPTAAWAASTLGLTQQLSYGGSAGTVISMPTGEGLILALNYSCGGEDCLGATITAPIPAGLSIGSVSVVSGASSSVSGNTVTITLPSTVAAGSAGQITVALGVPAWTTANGTVFTWQSSMAATGAASATSNSVQITANAASVTNASLARSTGGTLDEPVGYNAVICVQPAPSSSAVAVAAGSVAVVTLPAGAAFVSAADGGVYSAGTITWTLGQLTGCPTLRYVVEYPSATAGNTGGASKTTTLAWNGTFLGETGSQSLGTASLVDTIVPPTVAIGFDKWSYSGTAATTTSVEYFLSASNTGNTTADEMVIDDVIPDPLQITSVNASATSISTQPGEIWIASKLGADGVAGGGDDDVLVLAASIPANTSAGVAVYGPGAWPSGAAALTASDRVSRVVIKLYQVGPGQGAGGSMRATVMPEWFDGTETQVGDIVRNTAKFSYHVISGSVDEQVTEVPNSHDIEIVPQVTTITTSLGGGGTLAPGVSTFTENLGMNAGPFILKNPVLTMIIPEGVNFVSAVPSSTTVLPTPTLTVVPAWAGTTATLYRWTYPVGTELAVGTGYTMSVNLQLASDAWGNKVIRGFGSSATEPYGCTWNFFEGGPDTEDKDGDGNTTEGLCNWNDSVSPAPSTSGALTVAVDSAYSSGFQTGTAYTAPGGSDVYRLSMRNAGTLPLNQVVVVAVLPRPGDLYTLSSATRNPTAHTFPVELTGAAVAPTLTSTPVVYYSTAAVPCLPELAYSAGGCAAANWSTTLPADASTVTAVKVDFGSNTLNPYVTWNIDLPVTTPTAGATEPEFAEINPDPTAPLNDERAAGTAAFSALTQSSTTLTAESSTVSLLIPGIDGAPGVPPVVSNLSSTGVATATQTASAVMPAGGDAFLLDGTTEVLSLTVAGEGTYTIDPATGVITFEPQLGFSGTSPGVSYGVRNSFGASASALYLPTVTLPAGPAASALSSVESFGSRVQSVSAVVPTGGSIALVSGGARVSTLTVPGEGQYTVTPAGLITFTALPGFTGVPTPISYEIADAYGQTALAVYAAGFVSLLASLASTGVNALLVLVAAALLVLGGALAAALARWRAPAALPGAAS